MSCNKIHSLEVKEPIFPCVCLVKISFWLLPSFDLDAHIYLKKIPGDVNRSVQLLN